MRREIGQRITASESKGELIIKINQRLEGWQEMALLGWLVVWTSMGIYVAISLLSAEWDQERFFFFLTYLAFWSWFEYKALFSYLFKRFGFELLRFRGEQLYLKRSLFGMGKTKRYLLSNITKFTQVEHGTRSFAAAYNRSFWVVGNERLTFRYLDQHVNFGMHLTDEETRRLQTFLNRNFRRSL